MRGVCRKVRIRWRRRRSSFSPHQRSLPHRSCHCVHRRARRSAVEVREGFGEGADDYEGLTGVLAVVEEVTAGEGEPMCRPTTMARLGLGQLVLGLLGSRARLVWARPRERETE